MRAHAPAFQLRLALVVERGGQIVDFLCDGGTRGRGERRGIRGGGRAAQFEPLRDRAARFVGSRIDHVAAGGVLRDALLEQHGIRALEAVKEDRFRGHFSAAGRGVGVVGD